MTEDFVILVDKNDLQIGLMPKTEAHQKAMLHRAISVFIFNKKGDWLIQRRALTKYHSAGLWTNTCCTHPLPNESNVEAANRRLLQEMGMHCELTEIFDFIYKEKLDNELTEYELDHVFVGTTDALPIPNPNEVMEYNYVPIETILKHIDQAPLEYTVWFKKIVERVEAHVKGL